MIRTIAATLLAATSFIGLTSAAEAQTKYFARERIIGVSRTSQPTVYVPTYSKTYGACAGSSKSYPIESCSTSDGKPANLSDCAAFPQTTGATSCQQYVTCGPLSVDSGPNGNGGFYAIPGNVSTPAAAMNACNTYLTQNQITQPGTCYFVRNVAENSFNNRAVWFKDVPITSPYGDRINYYAAYCK